MFKDKQNAFLKLAITYYGRTMFYGFSTSSGDVAFFLWSPSDLDLLGKTIYCPD